MAAKVDSRDAVALVGENNEPQSPVSISFYNLLVSCSAICSLPYVSSLMSNAVFTVLL